MTRQYTKQDVVNWFDDYSHHISHVIVAHTHIRPVAANKQLGTFERFQRYCLDKTSNSLRYALNCLDAKLYHNQSNKVKRNKSEFKPLTFVTIEGARETTDSAQTVHVNIMMGNLPSTMSTQELERLFRWAWVTKAQQRDDIFVASYKHEHGKFSGYILKETDKDKRLVWGDNSIIDIVNCWIPRKALTQTQ